MLALDAARDRAKALLRTGLDADSETLASAVNGAYLLLARAHHEGPTMTALFYPRQVRVCTRATWEAAARLAIELLDRDVVEVPVPPGAQAPFRDIGDELARCARFVGCEHACEIDARAVLVVQPADDALAAVKKMLRQQAGAS